MSSLKGIFGIQGTLKVSFYLEHLHVLSHQYFGSPFSGTSASHRRFREILLPRPAGDCFGIFYSLRLEQHVLLQPFHNVWRRSRSCACLPMYSVSLHGTILKTHVGNCIASVVLLHIALRWCIQHWNFWCSW